MKNLKGVYTPDNLDVWSEYWMSDMKDIMQKRFRRGRINHKPTNQWYTTDLKIMRSKLNALYKRFVKNSQNGSYREAYVRERNNYKKQVRIAKKRSWINFCSSTDNAFGNLYKFLSDKSLTHTDFIYTALENSAHFSTYDDVAADLMVEHFHVDERPKRIFSYVSHSNYNDEVEYLGVTDKELAFALKQQAIGNVPGPDELDAIIVKQICNKHKFFAKMFFDKCLSLGHFPTIWKKGQVIFFSKRNKSPTSPRGYRPITLLSIFGKILERIIKTRIMTRLEYLRFFDVSQHGFREGMSTITALDNLKHLVREKLNNVKYCSMISLDFEGAFDSVD